MEQLKHFAHKHRLILDKNPTRADIVCHGCNQSITIGTLFYSCTRVSSASNKRRRASCVNFFLHQTCAELPQTLPHPMHQAHHLTLNYSPNNENWSWSCDGCRKSDWQGFTYSCNECEFYFCLRCVFEEGIFQQKYVENRDFRHEGHEQHSLTLVHRSASFECDACGTREKDLSFVCNSCQFWIHQSCALLPSTMRCRSHMSHPLVLAYSLPQIYRTFRQLCNICKNTMFPRRWLYYCVGCRFFAHLKCATLPSQQMSSMASFRQIENDEADVAEPNLVHFPLPDEPSLDTIVQQFIRASRDDTTITPAQINHWSHKDHPLVLFNEPEIGSNNTQMLGENDDQLLCDGCVGPILTHPFYGCIQCKFFLHQICAKLSLQLTHPSHNHKLVCGKYTEPNFYVKCDNCEYICNGMFFSCNRCKFYLDIKCALLPNTIKHESHKHPLSHHDHRFIICICKGCGLRGYKFFGCTGCDFHLCRSCTFMPRTIRHRWDPHPIPLVYPPIEDHPDIFYCEICEEEINTNYWLYFCRACDHSFHTTCLYPYYAFSNIKFGATNLNVADHRHNLTFVGMKKHKFGDITCGSCGNDIDDGSPVLECEPCHFRQCGTCSHGDDKAVCLLEACERTEEEGSKWKEILFDVLSSDYLIFIFCVIFVLWIVYESVLFLLVRLYLIPCIILVIWFGFVA